MSLPPAEERRSGLVAALAELGLISLVLAIGIGLVATVIAVASGHRVSNTIAVAYYLVGSLLFLIGAFPTGGFSMVRGKITQRRPMGSRQEPVFLSGVVLIALGVLADIFSF
jgi:hypothetical protein